MRLYKLPYNLHFTSKVYHMSTTLKVKVSYMLVWRLMLRLLCTGAMED